MLNMTWCPFPASDQVDGMLREVDITQSVACNVIVVVVYMRPVYY